MDERGRLEDRGVTYGQWLLRNVGCTAHPLHHCTVDGDRDQARRPLNLVPYNGMWNEMRPTDIINIHKRDVSMNASMNASMKEDVSTGHSLRGSVDSTRYTVYREASNQCTRGNSKSRSDWEDCHTRTR